MRGLLCQFKQLHTFLVHIPRMTDSRLHKIVTHLNTAVFSLGQKSKSNFVKLWLQNLPFKVFLRAAFTRRPKAFQIKTHIFQPMRTFRTGARARVTPKSSSCDKCEHCHVAPSLLGKVASGHGSCMPCTVCRRWVNDRAHGQTRRLNQNEQRTAANSKCVKLEGGEMVVVGV